MRAENSHLDTKNDKKFYVSQKSMIGFREFDLVTETMNISMASNKKSNYITCFSLCYVQYLLRHELNIIDLVF